MSAHPFRIAAVSLLAASAGACATASHSAADHPVASAPLPGKAACFFLANLNGSWTVLNDTTLIVYAPLPKDAYLIKLFEPIVGLRFQQALGFQDIERTGRICDNTQDYLVVRGYQPPGIAIVAVRRLTPPEQQQLLKAAGNADPRNN